MKTTKGYAVRRPDSSPGMVVSTRKLVSDDRLAVIRWASDDRAIMRIVRNAADMPCNCVAANLNNCLSCQARKVMKK